MNKGGNKSLDGLANARYDLEGFLASKSRNADRDVLRTTLRRQIDEIVKILTLKTSSIQEIVDGVKESGFGLSKQDIKSVLLEELQAATGMVKNGKFVASKRQKNEVRVSEGSEAENNHNEASELEDNSLSNTADLMTSSSSDLEQQTPAKTPSKAGKYSIPNRRPPGLDQP
jgi:hypothetical protein